MAVAIGVGGPGDLVPLVDEQLQVLLDVGLELEHGLGRKGVRYDLPLAGVLGPVPRVEEPAADRHEGVVEVPASC